MHRNQTVSAEAQLAWKSLGREGVAFFKLLEQIPEEMDKPLLFVLLRCTLSIHNGSYVHKHILRSEVIKSRCGILSSPQQGAGPRRRHNLEVPTHDMIHGACGVERSREFQSETCWRETKVDA